ncbi:MAG: hypothetical protein AB8F95_18555 [Bacteroidia bacterium]
MTFLEKITLTLQAWPLWLVVAIVVVAVYVWGRWQSKRNTINRQPGLPREIPPHNLSPAILRYVYIQDVDGDSLIAAVLNAVVKNLYRVRWYKDSFIIRHNPTTPPTRMTRDERAALTFNGRHYIKEMKVGRIRNKFTRKAEIRLRNHIQKRHKKWLFPYKEYLAASLGLSLIVLAVSAMFIGPMPHPIMLPYFMLIIPMLGFCLWGVSIAWTLGNYASLPIAAVFTMVCVLVLGNMESVSSAFLFPFLIPVGAIHFYWYKKMPRLRPEGGKLRREVEEFRQFLIQKIETNPKLSPTEYYLLPYLIALEIPFDREAFFSELLTEDRGVRRLPGSPIS